MTIEPKNRPATAAGSDSNVVRWLGIGAGVAFALALVMLVWAWRHASHDRLSSEDVKARVEAEMNRIEAEARRIEQEASK